MARCSSLAVLTATSTLSRARNSTTRRAGLGRPPAASPPDAIGIRQRCCPTARCSSLAVTTPAIPTALLPARNSTIRERNLDDHRQPRRRTLLSYGNVAAQWQGARRWRLQPPRPHSRERGTLHKRRGWRTHAGKRSFTQNSRCQGRLRH